MEQSLPFINEYFKLLEINTCRRKAHFFAQVRVETGFSNFTENLNYSYDNLMSSAWIYYRGNDNRCRSDANQPRVIGNTAYNGRMDNRTGTDDGYNFRGRGLIQTTGRYSYTIFQKFYEKNREKLGLPDITFASSNSINETPDKLSEPRYAVLSGVVDWVNKRLNPLADNTSDIEAVNKITSIINHHTPTYSKREASYKGGKWSYQVGERVFSGEYKTASREIFKVDECGKSEKPLQFIEGDIPPWMIIALEEYDKYKDYYEKDNPLKKQISEYFKLTGNPDLKYSDPWCGAFIQWCFCNTQNYKDTNPKGAAGARDWGPKDNPYLGGGKDGWLEGEECEPFYGAIAVFKNISHVAFIVGYNSTTKKYIYLGGNQGGGDGRPGYQKIRLGSATKAAFLYVMKPKKYTITEENKKLPENPETAIDSHNSTR